MNLIGVVLGGLGFAGMFLSALNGMTTFLGLATAAMWIGVALIAFSRAIDARATIVLLRQEGISPPLLVKIGQIFWALVGVLLLAQCVTEIFGFPLIEF